MKDHIRRIEYLKEAEKAANDDPTQTRTYTIKNWRGKPLYRKIISVDVDYLMFRIENSRTIRQQLRFLRDHPTLPKTLFNDPESSQAQDAQENILIAMINTTGQEFLRDLQLRGQDDPAIITYDGYIVNGNRRVAALKRLGERYIDCVILPKDANPRDIYELEQQLQISQDFKENYHWINELINISQGIKDKRYGYKEEQQAQRLRVSRPEVESKLRMMDLVDSFLIWKKISKEYDYSKLDDAEQVFKDLEKAVKKYKNDDKKRQEFTNAVFNLIEERPSRGRLYEHVKNLIRDFDQIYERVAPDFKSNNNVMPASDLPQENEEILDNLLEGEEEGHPEVFGDADKASEISPILINIIADVKAENKEKKDAEAVYESVSAALRELQGLFIDNDTAKLDSIRNKLEQIILTAKELLKQMDSAQD
jgi:hypothetical protein